MRLWQWNLTKPTSLRYSTSISSCIVRSTVLLLAETSITNIPWGDLDAPRAMNTAPKLTKRGKCVSCSSFCFPDEPHSDPTTCNTTVSTVSSEAAHFNSSACSLTWFYETRMQCSTRVCRARARSELICPGLDRVGSRHQQRECNLAEER
jgi:hypothetical protein